MANRQPTSRKGRDRKKPDDGEDIFVAKVYEATTWAEKNRLTLVFLGLVLVVLVVGIYSWVDYRGRLQEEAVVQLEQIQQTVSDPETAKSELQQYLSRFGGTPYAGEARMLLAELHLHGDEYDRAIEVLEASEISPREPVGLQIAMLKGKAYEAAGRYDEAQATYLEVADRADLEFMSVTALDDAARLRERQGEWAGAAELYQQILDLLDEGDPSADRYRMRLAEARTAAEGSS